jgi:PLP dependent protein
MTSIDNLARLRASIAGIEKDFGRKPDSVQLIAVSKTFPAEAILPVLEAGQRVFGENYVQEARAKWPGLRERFPDAEVHMIGPLQSNKADDAVKLFDAIHTLDRESLAKELAKSILKIGRKPLLFVQVNTGLEPQKGGVDPREAAAFVARCRETHGLELNLPLLSMGMSADYEAAIQLGATHVRVGSAIFGAR